MFLHFEWWHLRGCYNSPGYCRFRSDNTWKCSFQVVWWLLKKIMLDFSCSLYLTRQTATSLNSEAELSTMTAREIDCLRLLSPASGSRPCSMNADRPTSFCLPASLQYIQNLSDFLIFSCMFLVPDQVTQCLKLALLDKKKSLFFHWEKVLFCMDLPVVHISW